MSENDKIQEGRKVWEEYGEFLNSLIDQLRPYSFLWKEIHTLEGIVKNLIEPFNIAVFGRMKTGKSTFINAMIGKKLAITGVEEATATINRMTYAADGDSRLKSFVVHWNDQQPETYPIERLQQDWTGTSEQVLERIKKTKFLELFSDAPIFKDVVIIDTPGTGSSVAGHEVIAKQFIDGQEADALIYVFSPVGRETDEEALAAFRKGCVPGSSPYNSVAVLHKWDHIYWENGGDMDDIRAKARRLREVMKEMVAEVLPVSAPLALIAKSAGDEFWTACFDILKTFPTEGELKNKGLSRDGKWDRDESRARLRSQAVKLGMPWSSFQVMMRHLYRNAVKTPDEARRLILELSGLSGFDQMLKERFREQSDIIKRQQTRTRVHNVLRVIYNRIEDHLKDLERDYEMIEKLIENESRPELRSWLQSKRYQLEKDRHNLRDQWKKIDKTILDTKTKHDTSYYCIELLPWLKGHSGILPDQSKTLLEKILEDPKQAKEQDVTQDKDFNSLLTQVSRLALSPNREIREKAEQMRDILMEFYD